MARPVPAPRLLVREEALKVIVDPIFHLILNRGGSSAIRVCRVPLPHPAA